MDGDIDIESGPGQGSTLVIILPAEAADEPAEGTHLEEPIGSWADTSGSPT